MKASTGCIEKGRGSNNEHMVPGWNDSVTDLHAEARDAYVLWRNFGKPRFGPLCQLMRRTRLSFKYAIRQVKRNEDRVRADAMAKDLESKNNKSFWKKVSKINRKHLPLPNVLNGCHGEKDIANMWRDHYETLLNCVKSDECKEKIIDFLSSDNNIKNVVIQPCQVKEALKSAKLGKACGHDGLAAEHFIFADGSICVYLSMLYSSMLSHGYLPEEFMK